MTIIESPNSQMSLHELEDEVNKYMTSSAVRFDLVDLGEGKGGQVRKVIMSDGSTDSEGKLELTVEAGEEKLFRGKVLFIGS